MGTGMGGLKEGRGTEGRTRKWKLRGGGERGSQKGMVDYKWPIRLQNFIDLERANIL